MSKAVKQLEKLREEMLRIHQAIDSELKRTRPEAQVTCASVGIRPVVAFVAGPFRGADHWEITQNIQRAEHLAYRVAEAGMMPLTPHLNTKSFHQTLTDEFWLEGTMELMRRCDAVVTLPNWKESTGARAEVAEAERLGIPVFHNLEALSAWLKQKQGKGAAAASSPAS